MPLLVGVEYNFVPHEVRNRTAIFSVNITEDNIFDIACTAMHYYLTGEITALSFKTIMRLDIDVIEYEYYAREYNYTIKPIECTKFLDRDFVAKIFDYEREQMNQRHRQYLAPSTKSARNI